MSVLDHNLPIWQCKTFLKKPLSFSCNYLNLWSSKTFKKSLEPTKSYKDKAFSKTTWQKELFWKKYELKKILTAHPEIIQYETFGPNSPICSEKILFGKTLLSGTDWKLSLGNFFQKSLEQFKSYKDKGIFKTNWQKEFFSKK